jgi:flavin reductase (DIM6/NTAB) family NADH-FMN oxidoreductase RutF
MLERPRDGRKGEAMGVMPDGGPLAVDDVRLLLRQQASTVAVVTVFGPPPAGFTATSFTSVSLRPPLVSVNLALDSSVWPAVRRAGYLAVNLLAEDQEEVARAFARPGVDRIAGHGDWRPGPHRVPLLGGVLAWLVCRVTDRVVAGDHVIVLAQPLAGHHAGTGAPLLYHRGRYTRLDRDAAVPLSPR